MEEVLFSILKLTLKDYQNELMEFPFHQKTYSKRILQKLDQNSLLNKFSLPKYNGEGTVKFKGLHHVNQQKIFMRHESH